MIVQIPIEELYKIVIKDIGLEDFSDNLKIEIIDEDGSLIKSITKRKD